MTEKPNVNTVNCDEHLALKKLLDNISDDELEIAKKYIEALALLNKKAETKPKG
ncbi:hypothetical protein ACQKNX_07670 [Lysinibacillus sp. NPDC093712]|uniref:hypothetical protein n=1 Tax=Lysinibacillus sp. NPDC093712 TaxID=3390579 RepID=UPI003D03981B